MAVRYIGSVAFSDSNGYGDTMYPTIRELAEWHVKHGQLGTYDYARPIAFDDDMRATIGESPCEIVWSYPAHSIYGQPFALTASAANQLERYNAAKG